MESCRGEQRTIKRRLCRRLNWLIVTLRRIAIRRMKARDRHALFLLFGTSRPTNSEIEYVVFGNNMTRRHPRMRV
jgi:hypothetical protein